MSDCVMHPVLNEVYAVSYAELDCQSKWARFL